MQKLPVASHLTNFAQSRGFIFKYKDIKNYLELLKAEPKDLSTCAAYKVVLIDFGRTQTFEEIRQVGAADTMGIAHDFEGLEKAAQSLGLKEHAMVWQSFETGTEACKGLEDSLGFENYPERFAGYLMRTKYLPGLPGYRQFKEQLPKTMNPAYTESEYARIITAADETTKNQAELSKQWGSRRQEDLAAEAAEKERAAIQEAADKKLRCGGADYEALRKYRKRRGKMVMASCENCELGIFVKKFKRVNKQLCKTCRKKLTVLCDAHPEWKGETLWKQFHPEL